MKIESSHQNIPYDEVAIPANYSISHRGLEMHAGDLMRHLHSLRKYCASAYPRTVVPVANRVGDGYVHYRVPGTSPPTGPNAASTHSKVAELPSPKLPATPNKTGEPSPQPHETVLGSAGVQFPAMAAKAESEQAGLIETLPPNIHPTQLKPVLVNGFPIASQEFGSPSTPKDPQHFPQTIEVTPAGTTEHHLILRGGLRVKSQSPDVLVGVDCGKVVDIEESRMDHVRIARVDAVHVEQMNLPLGGEAGEVKKDD